MCVLYTKFYVCIHVSYIFSLRNLRCSCSRCLKTEIKILGNIRGFGLDQKLLTSIPRQLEKWCKQNKTSMENHQQTNCQVTSNNSTEFDSVKRRKTKQPTSVGGSLSILKHQQSSQSSLPNTGCPQTQVKRNETPVNLQSAFHEKTLSMAWHPDRSGGNKRFCE